MDVERNPWRFLVSWLLATLGGWVLGIVVMILLGELAGVGENSSVGIGMGSSVGFAQWRAARKWFSGTTQWMWASALGIGAPFMLADVIGAGQHNGWIFVPLASLGGLLSSLWQRQTLQTGSVRANWWVPACTVGWGSAAVLPAALCIAGPHLSNVAAILGGGLLLGIVTGGTLIWVLKLQTVERCQ